LEVFLDLPQDYQRDVFIEEFWKARDPYPDTQRNEFRDEWMRRLDAVAQIVGSPDARDERGRILLYNGLPTQRLVSNCGAVLWPTEVWYYRSERMLGNDLLLIFYQRWKQGAYRLWELGDGVDDLLITPFGVRGGDIGGGGIANRCGRFGEAVEAAIRFQTSQGTLGALTLIAEIYKDPIKASGEWLASFKSYSTELPADAPTFDADVQLAYPARRGARTLAQVTALVPTEALTAAQLGSHRAYNLLINGEILRGDDLFDRFRIKFDVPAAALEAPADADAAVLDAATVGLADGDDAILPLTFERPLRQGSYRLILRLDDVNSPAVHRSEWTLEVPAADSVAMTEAARVDRVSQQVLREANQALARGSETTVEIAPLTGTWQVGLVRIDALVTESGQGAPVDAVVFKLDGRPILTKRTAPFGVELDLGDVPRPRTLRVTALDADGNLLADDEKLLNAGRHRFAVRLTEPRTGDQVRDSVRASADVRVPEGETLDRVVFHLDAQPVATLYQPPWTVPIRLAGDGLPSYVRAVAHTVDGMQTEDLAFINAPDYVDELEIAYVELYTAVLGRDDRPVADLPQDAFRVFEDDVEQEILRFEKVRDLPVHVAVMLDVSASMIDRLPTAQQAALDFFQDILTPKDRAAVVTFNDHPSLTASFTNDLDTLAGGLAGVRAERGTALYDSVVFALYYFNGIQGQRAILLLSDGQDESSRFAWEDTLEYARRAGVAIYSIGLDLPRSEREARRKLRRLAEETGGRSFFIDDIGGLASVYASIQEELRARYLLAYQSSNTSGRDDFRRIEVEVDGGGREAKTLRGYYP
ncbi:MAG: VWA domain-containing protein, partial [Acidobacteriota bacterium]